ncbi:PLDc N-terminal domain-containing protein [Patescibacteria group bacterium]|nr:PLDc N-terminal domain-containing protein [Patescibacteria group bacterium]
MGKLILGGYLGQAIVHLAVVSDSGGSSDAWPALLIAAPFLLVWAVWMLFIFLWWIFIFVVVVGGSILWVVMLIDVVSRDFKRSEDKTMWLLIVCLTGVVGALIYYFMVKRKE